MGHGVRRGKVVLIGAVLVGLVAMSPVIYTRCDHFLLTGRFSPIDQVETLQGAVAVNGWSEDGLLLADGRTITLPGLTSLPKASVALAAATERGVQAGQDGRVYGLVKIHHWCGNDPVRNHVARVDLAHMLMYFREGEPSSALAEAMFGHRQAAGFSQSGWNISDYLGFKSFEQSLPYERELLQAEKDKSRP